MMAPGNKAASHIGAVVIGRNEGERLQICLQSLLDHVHGLIYVDSGSTDNSLQIAASLGVQVINLDMTIPFTAARARNEGFAEIQRLWRGVSYVQFIDGDCEVVEGWINAASYVLDTQGEVAVACGRRRERFSDRSVFNKLCDIEWDTPVGEASACGGDALIRVSAFEQVGGYNPNMIAGEEPEMCVRLRHHGWKILRIDEEMTLHDADMSRASQWWKRTMRAGHAYAEGVVMHGKSPERHWVGEARSNWFWGISFPVLLIFVLIWPNFLLLCLIYPLQIVRIYQHSCKRRSQGERWIFAIFCVLAKLPLMLGQVKYYVNHFLGRQSRLIEYK